MQTSIFINNENFWIRTKQVPTEEKFILDVGDRLDITTHTRTQNRTISQHKPYPQGRPRNTRQRYMEDVRIKNTISQTGTNNKGRNAMSNLIYVPAEVTRYINYICYFRSDFWVKTMFIQWYEKIPRFLACSVSIHGFCTSSRYLDTQMFHFIVVR